MDTHQNITPGHLTVALEQGGKRTSNVLFIYVYIV
jgi:hypothetical protein